MNPINPYAKLNYMRGLQRDALRRWNRIKKEIVDREQTIQTIEEQLKVQNDRKTGDD